MAEPSERTVILNLLRAAVPERAQEITACWKRFDPKVEIISDRVGTTMNASRHRIQFDMKTLRAFWLIGFSAWRSIECYSPSLVVAEVLGISVDQALTVDENLATFERYYKERLAAAQTLLAADASDNVPWPDDIPQPTVERSLLSSVQAKVAFDLVLLATAFVFLHELRHVLLDGEETRPKVPAEEEMACDVWAREILTAKLASYAAEHGHQYGEVLKKRSMGLAMGAIILDTITPALSRNDTKLYPSIGRRMEALLSGMGLPDNSSFWMLTSCLLIGVMRQQRLPLAHTPVSAKGLTERLIEDIRNQRECDA